MAPETHRLEQEIREEIERHRENLRHLINRHQSLTHPDVVRESQAIDRLLNRLNRLKHGDGFKGRLG